MPSFCHTTGASSDHAAVTTVYMMATRHPKRSTRPATMIGSSRGDEIKKVMDVLNATPDFSMPASTGSVEHEQNGVIAPSARPFTGPGMRPLAIH